VAEWDGDHLTLDIAQSGDGDELRPYGAYFGTGAECADFVRRSSAAGFGSKAILNGPQLLGILAARMMQRPVKLVLTRAQMYGRVGHRGETRQT